jgi:hypothetical protein
MCSATISTATWYAYVCAHVRVCAPARAHVRACVLGYLLCIHKHIHIQYLRANIGFRPWHTAVYLRIKSNYKLAMKLLQRPLVSLEKQNFKSQQPRHLVFFPDSVGGGVGGCVCL